MAQPRDRNPVATHPAALRDVLARAGGELQRLHDRIDDIEHLALPLLSARGEDGAAMRQIQDLDHIRQSVGALAAVMIRLAALAPQECLIDAEALAQASPLADLAARLAAPEGRGASAGPGEVELF